MLFFLFRILIALSDSTNPTIVIVTIIIITITIIIIIAVLTLILFPAGFTSSDCCNSSAAVGQPLPHELVQALPNLSVSADKGPCLARTKPKVKGGICCALKLSSVLSSGALTPQSVCPTLWVTAGWPY